MNEMKQKTALVTGGGRGIGAAVCRALAQEGFRVIIQYHTSSEKAAALAAALKKESGTEHIALKADLRREEEIGTLFERAGPVDVLVNNAGVAWQGLLTDMTVKEWDELFSVNVRGAFLCTKQALPHMVHEKAGSIVFVSSMWGQTGASCEVAYSASKAALIGMTKSLAKELGPSNIRVNCVAPGVIQTDMNSRLSPEDMKLLREETPLERIGTPEEAAEAVRFLCSERASFITGEVLSVNGGFVI